MATPTVIDQLVVRLGLDPKQFTKGQKEAAASVIQTENQVRRSGDGMNRALASMAAKWLSVAAVIAGVKATVGVIDDVARRTRQLGIDSRNYGLAADELRNFENAVEMAGGSAEDARKFVAGFQRAIFDLAYNGQVSDSLVMLARLGVQFQTSTGQARDFRSIVLDTTDAIAKSGMDRNSAFQFLQQAGFDSGTAELMLAGRAQVEAALAQQGARRQITGADFQKATDIMTARIGREQAVETVKVSAMQSLGGIQENVNEFLDRLASGGPSEALERLTKGASDAGTALENWALRAAGITRGIRNNNPANLRAVGDQRRDREGFRVFNTMEEGILEANAQLDRDAQRGINTIEKLIAKLAPPNENDTEGYIRFVSKLTGIARNAPLDESDRAMVLSAIFRKESGTKAPSSEDVADVLTMQRDFGPSPIAQSSGAIPTPNGQRFAGGSVTNVDIDNITVNTQAKDAQRMADDMDGAIRRKLLASHAEQGMQ